MTSAARSGLDEVPRNSLKSVKGVGHDLRAFGNAHFAKFARQGTGGWSCAGKECQSSRDEQGLEALLRIVGLIVIGVTVSAVDGACSCI
jgi:hypothetical protein